MIELVPGSRYRVTYRIPGVQNRSRVLVARFLEHTSGWRTASLVFDLRPVAGTLTLEASWVETIRLSNAPVSAPTIVRPHR